MDDEYQNERPHWSRVGFAAAWSAGVALISLTIGGGAQQLAGAISAPAAQIATTDSTAPAGQAERPAFRSIDYDAVGSVTGPRPLFAQEK